MYKFNNKTYTEAEIEELIKNNFSISAISLALGYAQYNRRVASIINSLSIDKTHFISGKLPPEIVEKVCPVCNKKFKISIGLKKKKITCSRSCANIYFRSGEDHPSYKNDSKNAHRIICFKYHEKKCVVCGEDLIVEAHHYDGNHKNNNPENFIPLCPTHHKYIHSNKYKYIILECVDEYIKNFSLKIT